MGIHQRNGNGGFTRGSELSSEGQPTTGGYAAAVSVQSDSAVGWYNYGDVLLALKRYDEALSPLRKAVQLSPSTALIRYDLGMALFQLDRHDEARSEFAVILAADPKLTKASSMLVLSSLINMALAQDNLGQSGEAAGPGDCFSASSGAPGPRFRGHHSRSWSHTNGLETSIRGGTIPR
jgi:tetratricopeptide (TPR) repeat protein